MVAKSSLTQLNFIKRADPSQMASVLRSHLCHQDLLNGKLIGSSKMANMANCNYEGNQPRKQKQRISWEMENYKKIPRNQVGVIDALALNKSGQVSKVNVSSVVEF